MVLTLGIAYWAINLMVALFLVVCVVLILTVLIQRPQGGGLSGAFGAGGGGSGSGQTAFGARTGDALTMATIAMFIIYLGVAVALNFAVRPDTAPRGGARLVAPGGVGIEDGTTPADDGGESSEGIAEDSADAGEGEDGAPGDGTTDEAGDVPAADPEGGTETDPDGAP